MSPAAPRRPGPAARLRRLLVRTGAVAHKESLHIVRDSRTLYLALGMPVVLIVIFGFGVTFDQDRVPLALVDQDRTPLSRELVLGITAGGTFQVVIEPESPDAADGLFRAARATAALVVPAGFQRDWRSGRTVRVQWLLDGSDGTTAGAVLGDAVAATRGAAAGLDGGSAGTLPIQARVRLLFNPELRSAVFFVPGLVVYVLAIGAVLLTALTIAREWERGNLEQLFATPIGRLEIVLGKLLPYLAIGFVQALLVLVVGMWVFDVPFRGGVPTLALGTFLFLAGSLCQGLFISVVARTQQVATQVGALSSLLPGLLLSGFLFPIENMPRVLQLVSYLFPARYFIATVRGVLLKGNGLEVLWPQYLGMTLFFGVMLALTTLRFRRSLA